MISSLKKLVEILPPEERRNAFLLFVMMSFAALLEVVGIAAVPAFVSMIASPGTLRDVPVLGHLTGLLEPLDSREAILWGSITLVLIFALKNAFLILNFYMQVRFITRQRISFSTRLTDAYMRAPYTFHLTRNTAELLRNVGRESGMIANSVLGPLLEACTRIIIMVSVLVLLFIAEPWITLYWSAIFAAIALFGTTLVSKKLRDYGLQEQTQGKVFNQALYQGFGTIKEARVLNRERFFRDNVDRSVRKMATVARFKLFAGKVISPITEFVAITGLLGLAVGLVLLGRPVDSILVTLSLFVFGLVRLRETLNASLMHLANLRYNVVSIEPVYADLKLLEKTGKELDRPGTVVSGPPLLHDRIELRDVWYRYDATDDFSLKEVNVSIPAGGAVGIVGSTGAGKSTLVDVILGLLEPSAGGVFIDGKNVSDLGIANWQRRIGYVPQAIYLLDDTIRRNIALGIPDEEIDEKRLERTIEMAQLTRFIGRQPKGLDTEIGEQGTRISGGERQRIGIARALYHDPEVLVLDEATSALDNETERAVIAAVEAFRGKRTIIMIAHRLSTVRNCSELYFLKDGRVAANGSFDELRLRSAEFRQMAEGDAA